MKAIILAAGYATRLYPLTKNYPKPLLQVGEKKIIEWLLEDLDGIPEVEEHIVVSNHRFLDHFQQWAAGQRCAGKPLRILDDGSMDNENRLGAVMDIQLAAEKTGCGDVIVLAGDNVLDFSLRGFVDFFREKNASCVMCYKELRLERRQKTGIILTDGDGRVTAMQEKPKAPRSDLAVPPFYCYKGEDLRLIGQAAAEGCGTDAPGSFIAWLCERKPVYAYRMPGCRRDIGDMESYRAAQAFFRQKSDWQAADR